MLAASVQVGREALACNRIVRCLRRGVALARYRRVEVHAVDVLRQKAEMHLYAQTRHRQRVTLATRQLVVGGLLRGALRCDQAVQVCALTTLLT